MTRTAVITGAASGIGFALARRAAAEDMNLVLADIEAPRLADAIDTLGLPPERVLAHGGDLSLESTVAALADAAFERFGRVDLLCNNAGVALTRQIREMSSADWEWVLGANLWSVIHGVRHFLPRMSAQSWSSHIVNTASVAGLLSPPAAAAYNVSKHGVVTLSETLFHELRLEDSRVGVSVLCPAWVKTGINSARRNRPARFGDAEPAGKFSASQESQIAHALESSRLGPDDIADIVFAAVAEGRFYIIPHRRINEHVRQRFDDILAQRNPGAGG